eukprot:7636118-Lingulodinium_polyedra.AAC.1
MDMQLSEQTPSCCELKVYILKPVPPQTLWHPRGGPYRPVLRRGVCEVLRQGLHEFGRGGF